jgi:hypothetical protein
VLLLQLRVVLLLLMLLLLQVLSTLGSVAGKRVLELGAGIGRFTGELAKTGENLILHAVNSPMSSCEFLSRMTIGIISGLMYVLFFRHILYSGTSGSRSAA